MIFMKYGNEMLYVLKSPLNVKQGKLTRAVEKMRRTTFHIFYVYESYYHLNTINYASKTQ